MVDLLEMMAFQTIGDSPKQKDGNVLCAGPLTK